MNKYASLSDLSIDDYSASKALSYDSDLDREYAIVNQPSPDEPNANHKIEVPTRDEVKDENKADYSISDGEVTKSSGTSLFESEKPSETANKLSKSFSITYRSPNQQLKLYQLLGKYNFE